MKINYDSVKAICENATQAMIYGWEHCKYDEVFLALKKEDSPLKKVFDWSIADLDHKEKTVDFRTTLEGREIKQFAYDGKNNYEEVFKTGITNLIWENYQRHNEEKHIIPLIFCVDIDDNPYPTSPAKIASRDEENDFSTHSELRRCYKFCCELDKDPDLQKISAIARASIKFVKLKLEEPKQDFTYRLELIETPFWEREEWNQNWEKRQFTKSASSSEPKIHRWREQLKDLVKNSEN